MREEHARDGGVERGRPVGALMSSRINEDKPAGDQTAIPSAASSRYLRGRPVSAARVSRPESVGLGLKRKPVRQCSIGVNLRTGNLNVPTGSQLASDVSGPFHLLHLLYGDSSRGSHISSSRLSAI